MAAAPETREKQPVDRAHDVAEHIKHNEKGAANELHKDIQDMEKKSPEERKAFYGTLAKDTAGAYLPKGFEIVGADERAI
ncbi:MAG: hypothetical protein HC888_13480 [Candidatus Competibacteraceae bacterium]|nr:hypothetical protein [Candidatus Competibacteraceae bacterium]